MPRLKNINHFFQNSMKPKVQPLQKKEIYFVKGSCLHDGHIKQQQ